MYTKSGNRIAAESVIDIRARILEAALGLLAAHGVSELTQPKVARAAGVRQSHLTYYFPTRGDLLKAVAVRSIESILGALAGRATRGSLTTESLAQLAGDMVGDKRRARVMLGLVVTSDEDREIKQFLREFVTRIRANLADLVRMLGAEADPVQVAAFHALMVGTAILNVARDDAQSRRDCATLARFAVERVLFGTQAQVAAATPPRRRGRGT